MKENRRISVIVPVYRVEPYLEECICSIVNQTYENLEIILVDDGSPDNCPQLCDEWKKKDKRIRVLHKQNGGLSDARNAGLRMSTGELVMFVDSDDWIAPEMAEKMEEAMREYNADMALCQFVKVFPNGRRKTSFCGKNDVTLYDQKEMMKQLVRDLEVSNHVWRRLYKREFLPDDIFPKGKNYEDIYVMAELSGKCRTFVGLNAAYYYYRQNENGILRDKSCKNMEDYLTALEKSYTEIKAAYPELTVDVDYARARTTTYIWEDLHATNKATAEEHIRIRKEIEQWGSGISADAISRLFWRQRVYYKLIMRNWDFLASIWYELLFHEGNMWSALRKKVKRIVKRNSIEEAAA